MIRPLYRLFVIAIALIPSIASAHTGVGDPEGLLHGFFHPISGIDHILTMVGVGLLAAHLGGRALWLVPITFVSVMAAAGMAGTAGIEIPFVEIGIGLSVVVLGLAIAFQINIPTLAAMALVGFFAMFHGYAHGTEYRKRYPELHMALILSGLLSCFTPLVLDLGPATRGSASLRWSMSTIMPRALAVP